MLLEVDQRTNVVTVCAAGVYECAQVKRMLPGEKAVILWQTGRGPLYMTEKAAAVVSGTDDN